MQFEMPVHRGVSQHKQQMAYKQTTFEYSRADNKYK